MRGLPVPAEKRSYIVRDAAREARRYGIPFGHICDPVGVGVERALALYVHAEEQGRGLVLAQVLARAIWSEAADLTEDETLARLAVRAGLDAASAVAASREERFREVVERNRDALYELGHWGVPVLQTADLVVWGQDHIGLLLGAARARTVTP
jgi:2-hydroxychromene-2-carboxylate isomerase